MGTASDVKTIFGKAIAFDVSSERIAYLDQVCAANPQLRAEIDSLLQAHEAVGRFLEDSGPSPVATMDYPISERPGSVIGLYKLMEQIGEGGMGLVFVAEQQQPVRRRVALKIIKPGMDTREVIARFEAERQALAIMDHPNIARVLDAGTTASGRPYFVMELVKGIPIIEYCDQQQLTARERLELFLSVCQAVQHAHSKGIIHRDLKPTNILVAPHDGVPVVKVIDFGVAKAIGQQLTDKTIYTRFTQMIGTPLYMSPEQAEINALDVDIRSDVYSLGVLLYELLTGTTPFERERFATAAYDEIRRIIREEEPPRPSTRLSTLGATLGDVSARRKTEPAKLTALVRGELDWIVMKALEKDRNRRYETANLLAQDIHRYLDDDPVQACPPSAGYRLKKFLRRHRGPATAAAAVLFCLVGGLAVSLALYSRAELLRKRADAARDAEITKANQLLEALADRDQAIGEKTIALEQKMRALLDEQAALDRSEGLRLTAQSAVALLDNPGLALLLAIEGAERGPRRALHNNALLAALAECREVQTLEALAHDPSPDAVRAITTASFSHDGTRIVATAEGAERRTFRKGDITHNFRLNVGTAQVWDPAGRLITTIHAPPHQYFAGVQLSPDGRLLAGRFADSVSLTYGSREELENSERWLFTDRVVRIWDVNTGSELHVLRGHNDYISAVCFSPDSRRILTASWDKTARIWAADTGEQLAVVHAGSALETACFSPDGRRILGVSSGLDRHATYADEPGERQVPQNVDPPLSAEPPAKPICDVGSGSVSRGYRGMSMTATVTLPWLGSVKLGGNRRSGVRLWDAETRQEFSDGMLPQGGPEAADITFATFTADSRRVVAGTRRGTVFFLSADNGKRSLTFDTRNAAIRSITFSRDGRQMLLVYEDGGLAVRDAENGKELRNWPSSACGVRTAFYHFDGERVFVVKSKVSDAGGNGERGGPEASQPTYSPQTRTVSILDVATGKEFGLLKGHEDDVTGASLSPDGQLLVTASLDGTARIWQAYDATGYGTVLHGTGPVRAAVFSSDGRQVLAASARAYEQDNWNSFVTIWETASAKRIALLTAHDRAGQSPWVKRGLGGVRHMQLSPDGKRLLTVSDDRHARIIEPRAPNDVLFRTTEDQWPLAEEMPYTPVRVWDLATGRELYALNGLRCVVRWASFSPDGRRIATLSSRMEQYSYLQIKNGAATLNSTGGSLVNDRGLPQIHIWDASSGKLLLTISDLQNPDSDAWGSLAWSPDNRSIVVPGIFGVLDLAETRCFVLPGISAGSSALYSPDGRYLLTSIGGEATVFDLSALEPKKGSWGVQLEVRSFRPDGPEAVTTVTRGESRSCRTLKLTGHESPITAVVFSPDSRWIATTSADRTARIWATETGEMSHVLRGHERQVSGSAFSPDSRWLVTTSDDQTARIWELATGTEWLTLKGHQGAVRSAVFSPDGQHVLSASDDGTVRVWPKDPLQVALSRKPRELTTDERARLEIAPVQSPHTVH